MGLNGQEVLSGVEHEFHDSRHQAANLVKYRASEGWIVEIDDGIQGGAVTARAEPFLLLFCLPAVVCADDLLRGHSHNGVTVRFFLAL